MMLRGRKGGKRNNFVGFRTPTNRSTQVLPPPQPHLAKTSGSTRETGNVDPSYCVDEYGGECSKNVNTESLDGAVEDGVPVTVDGVNGGLLSEVSKGNGESSEMQLTKAESKSDGRNLLKSSEEMLVSSQGFHPLCTSHEESRCLPEKIFSKVALEGVASTNQGISSIALLGSALGEDATKGDVTRSRTPGTPSCKGEDSECTADTSDVTFHSPCHTEGLIHLATNATIRVRNGNHADNSCLIIPSDSLICHDVKEASNDTSASDTRRPIACFDSQPKGILKKRNQDEACINDSVTATKRVRFGVSGESLVWSPCSSLLSYSPPPLLSDLEDDLPSEGTQHPCPPPSPPQSSPSSPTDHVTTTPYSVSPMPPNDASSEVRLGRKGSNGERLMGRCAGTEPLQVSSPHILQQDGNTPHKDRPPDPLKASSPRTRRLSSKTVVLSSPRSPRKRAVDGYDNADRRYKTCRASADGSKDDGDMKFPAEGQVTTEPALLARLSGFAEGDSERKIGRCSPRSKGYSAYQLERDQDDKGHYFGLKGRSNGVRRSQDEVSRLKEAKQMLNNLNSTNNNLPSRNNNNNLPKERERRLSSHMPLSSLVSSAPLTTAASIPAEAFSSTNSFSSSSSSSSSSGLGSSLHEEGSSPNNSGTSTPTQPICSDSAPTAKVRFPPPEKKDAGDICRWRGCGAVLDQSSSLLEHIQAVHVEGQLEAESFRCLWVGCKVFDRASCSVSWLERHVLTHGGHKPFKCIVEGCGHRFRSQTALGRHVNHHFSSPTTAPAPRLQNHASPTKLIRKNGRKLRYRKRPWSARVFDFFDQSTMEKVQWGLYCATGAQTQAVLDTPSDHIILKSEVLCRRKCSGESEVLVRWSPNDILPDEWVKPEELQAIRSVAFHKLTHDAQLTAASVLYPSFRPVSSNRRKRAPHRRTASLSGVVSTPITAIWSKRNSGAADCVSLPLSAKDELLGKVNSFLH